MSKLIEVTLHKTSSPEPTPRNTFRYESWPGVEQPIQTLYIAKSAFPEGEPQTIEVDVRWEGTD